MLLIVIVVQTGQLPKDRAGYWQESARICLLMLTEKPKAIAIVMTKGGEKGW